MTFGREPTSGRHNIRCSWRDYGTICRRTSDNKTYLTADSDSRHIKAFLFRQRFVENTL